MNRVSTSALLLISLLLHGCAGMDAQECAVTDWRTVGYEDGARGAGAERIGRYREACGKHGVAPDLAGYQAGRDAGLREFCNSQNGFSLGAGGGNYGGVCPADLEPDFLAAYESGRELHALESRVYALDRQLRSHQYEKDEVEEALAVKSVALLGDGLTVEARAELIVELKHLAERKEQLSAEIRRLTRDKRRSERDLNRYRSELAYRF